jgi:hypothetical protein
MARRRGGLAKVGFPFFRHRPLYAGDPISFRGPKKMDRPDEPGDDEYW